MGDENERSMEIESEYEEEEEEKKGEAVEVESEEEEEDEIEELQEMPSPRLSCWISSDGRKILHGIMVLGDDINESKTNLHLDPCSICFQPLTSRGKHRISCLPCGHLYGFSCIKKWLLQSSFSGKCPQCNTLCAYKDVVPIYASLLCVRAHQKATYARYFPFSEQGFIDFKEHELLRRVAAENMYDEHHKRLNVILEQRRDIEKQQDALEPQWDDLLAQRAEMDKRAAELGQQFCELEGADALIQQTDALERLEEGLEQRYDALGRQIEALERRAHVLVRRYKAYEQNLKFFDEMYKEHLAQLKNTEPCAAHTS